MEKEYYRFGEVIDKHGLTREDLIYLGETGKLPVYLITAGIQGTTPEWEGTMTMGPYRIGAPQLLKVLSGAQIERLYLPTETGPWHGFGKCFYDLKESTVFSESDLVIMADDLEALTGRQKSINPSTTIDVAEYIHISEELCKNSGISLTTVRNRVKEAEGIEFFHDPDDGGKRKLTRLEFQAIITKTYKKITK